MINIIKIFEGKKIVVPIKTEEEYRKLRDSVKNKDAVAKARKGDGKAKLNCVQFNYGLNPSKPMPLSGCLYEADTFPMDIDVPEEIKANAEQVSQWSKEMVTLVMAHKEEIGLLIGELSPSRGLHLVLKKETGKTQLENQVRIANILKVEMDTNNKDITRVIFGTTASDEDLFYFDAAVLQSSLTPEESLALGKAMKERVANGEEELPDGAHTSNKHFKPWLSEQNTVAPAISTAATASVKDDSSAPKFIKGFEDYDGISWDNIINKYIEMFWNGRTPTEGSRNTSTFDIALDLRCICDYRQDVLETIIPRWANFPADEQKKTIANALKETRKGMTFRMRKLLEALGAKNNVERSESRPPLPPTRVPALLRLLSKHAPNHTKVAVMENVWAALGTHLSGVQFNYIDNVLHEATFMCVLLGPQSVGKGYIAKPIEAILRPIREKDAISRKKEAEYKRKNPSGAKKVKDPRPTDICIQVLADDFTDAAFSQRVIDAEANGGKFIYVRVDEIELLKKLTSSKKAEDVFLIIRKAFDNAEHGQERVGSDSVSGMAHLRFNFNASATDGRGVNFFKGAITDGTLTRLCLSTIIREDMENDNGEVPIQGNYNQKFHDELKPYLERLQNAKGIIRCRQAEKLAREMAKENYENALLLDSEAYRQFSYRANVIAYLKAMVLYIANNRKWSKEIETYIRWSYQYDIWCKMHYFGHMLDKAANAEKNLPTGDPRNILSLLKSEFTREEYLALRSKLGKSHDGRQLLSAWKSRGYIIFDASANKFIKTQKGLNK